MEREIKLEADERLDLEQLGGEPLEHRVFTSTYHDTPDRLLGRAGLTLRRRLEHGRSDWQLKLPANGARREVEAPGGPAGPPPEIADLLRAFLHGRELVQLATLRTLRSGVLVRDGAGSAEVLLDEVAVMDGQRVTKTFEEVEIELRTGDEAWLRTVAGTVKRLGARKGTAATKIARALGATDTKPAQPRTDRERLRAFFEQRYLDVLAADAGVRLGEDVEAVHDLRVAVRRLRAVLRAARPFVADEWAQRLREELDWLGRALGPLRDLDVMIDHLRAEAEALDPPDRVALGAAFRRLADDHDAARADALAALTSERYLALLAELGEPPPLLEADTKLDAVARKELRRLRRTMAQVDESAPDELLHKARIRAKRLRYVAEVLGEKRVVRRAKKLQDVAGEHQDAVVAQERLRELAARAPESTLALGRLVERENGRRERSRRTLGRSWKRLERAAAAAWA